MKNTVLICPRNDEESLMILKLAKAIELPTVVSKQPHGARLSREKDLLARVLDADPDVERVVIVELPGPKTEQTLKEQGLDVVVIDHHRYDDLDRMKQQSSLEQFRDLFDLSDARVRALGFEPRMVEAVGIIDRGFLWELRQEGFEGKEFQQAVVYYRQLTMELGEERREREEALAKVAWEHREERDGVIIVRDEDDKASIRDAISFLVAAAYPEQPPQTVILQGERRMYVQESDHAKALHDQFGGFTFGQDRCWGIQKEDGDLPDLDEVMEIIVE